MIEEEGSGLNRERGGDFVLFLPDRCKMRGILYSWLQSWMDQIPILDARGR